LAPLVNLIVNDDDRTKGALFRRFASGQPVPVAKGGCRSFAEPAGFGVRQLAAALKNFLNFRFPKLCVESASKLAHSKGFAAVESL
jgi:hypothetical protein